MVEAERAVRILDRSRGRSNSRARAKVLVLGLGNPLLQDDGIGLQLLDAVERLRDQWGDQVEFVDGGTQGLALLPYLADRSAVVILDAVRLGAEPGAIHMLTRRDLDKMIPHRATSAHEGNAGELLAAARLLGDFPDRVFVAGIEPDTVRTGLGISDAVARVLPRAAVLAVQIIQQLSKE